MNNLPVVFAALPLINEEENIVALTHCFLSQTYPHKKLIICINQPDKWWDDPLKNDICLSNQRTFRYLENLNNTDIYLIDKFSRGRGWIGKKHGVGWARKTIFDHILEVAADDDLIISLDGDTTYGNNYFSSVVENFRNHSSAVALAVPYFHNPVADQKAYRAILRYEIYMRYYSINMWRIASPYTFTALGSAMACRVKACRAIGGMTPKMSGEDFYFLQKLRKHGQMLFYNSEKVYPAARFSDRVYFGTGPAMIKGNQGDWESYPVYPYNFFDEVKETYDLFPLFYQKTIRTPFSAFLSEIFCEDDPFEPLRKNSPTVEGFVRACQGKADGLRILQYVKRRNNDSSSSNEENLREFVNIFYAKDEVKDLIPDDLSFEKSPIDVLEKIRTFLMKKEEEYQITSIPG